MRIADEGRLQKIVREARVKIEEWHRQVEESMPSGYWVLRHVDEFLANPKTSLLEKAMYLMLNQFPGDRREYFVVPHTAVRVDDAYELAPPGYRDYEIDFAAYAGSESRPVKIAIECDGLRSHRERHSDRDRSKDINLQAAGWIVVRFGSREIHDEIEKLATSDTHINRFGDIIERIVAAQSDAIVERRYLRLIGKLTGYTYGNLTCPSCGHVQWQAFELKERCRQCRTAALGGEV